MDGQYILKERKLDYVSIFLLIVVKIFLFLGKSFILLYTDFELNLNFDHYKLINTLVYYNIKNIL